MAAFVYNMTDTWDNAGTTFTAIKMNVTNTASAAASMLMDLQTDGVSSLQIDKNGRLLNDLHAPFASTPSAVAYAVGDYGRGMFSSGGGLISLAANNFEMLRCAGGLFVSVNSTLGIASDGNMGGPDVFLARDGAAQLAQRNGTNAQSFRVYHTYTDVSNYERGVFDWTTNLNTLTIGAQKAGSGSNRTVALVAAIGSYIQLSTNSSIYYACTSGGIHSFSDGSATQATIDATGLGYTPGGSMGGIVTQTSSKSTGVTLSKVTGQITMNAAALAADTTVSFVLTNTKIAATDMLILNHISGGTAGSYTLNARAAAGSASIDVRNITTGSLSEAIVIQFAIFKGATN